MSTRAVIHDACVLIDMAHGGLLADFTRLDWASSTSNLVQLEVATDPRLEAWLGRHVEVCVPDGGELAEVMRLHRAEPRISPADASALLLARKLGATLLTNDRQLRRLASSGDIAVLGVIGIMDCMHERSIRPGPTLCHALDRMIAAGARFPADECSLRRERWRR